MAQRAVLAHRTHHRQQLIETENDPGAAVLELITQLQRLAQRTDRRIHRATLEQPVKGDVQLRAVGHEQGDAVTRLHAQLDQ